MNKSNLVPCFDALKTSGKIVEIINSFDNPDFSVADLHEIIVEFSGDIDIMTIKARTNSELLILKNKGYLGRIKPGFYRRLKQVPRARNSQITIEFYDKIASSGNGLALTHKDTELDFSTFYSVRDRLELAGCVTVKGIRIRAIGATV